MGNRFTCASVPGTVDVKLSNQATSTLMCALALAGRGRATTPWERKLMYWLVQHDQERIGVGTVGFDVAELGWTADDFDHQRAFVLGWLDAALAGAGRDELPHAPSGTWLDDCLRQLRALVAAFPREAVALPSPDAWVPDEEPPHGRCELHGVDLHESGCIVCNG